MAQAVRAMTRAIEEDKSEPISQNEDEAYAVQRQLCTVFTTSSTASESSNIRATCPAVTITQTVACIIPTLSTDRDKEIMPHPGHANVFIATKGDEYRTHGWYIYSNPYHAAQPTKHLPIAGFIVIYLGRQILARGEVTLEFSPESGTGR